ncbi:MAG TPA: hydrolase [Micromonosporaceae bacterium]|nr:hydrolase [Micromonosporaceae bacterium]HCU48774.1 hydrolase [Micromonosporaceae bacterium]
MTNSSQLLVLWDVDGTLIHNGGVSKQAYAQGFELLTGKPPTEPVITDGMTDPAIMRSLFERHEIKLTAELESRVPAVMNDALASLVPQLRERGHAMPGAREAIDALAELPGVIQSVLTGNIAPNAFTKVATFDLQSKLDFKVGGFGSDDEIRWKLVGAARDKALAKYGITFDASNTVIIGDTLRDVEAGRKGGAHVIAIASGAFSEQQLSAEGADVVLPDLRNTDGLVRSLLSFRART